MAPREIIMLLAMCLVWGLHMVVIKATAGTLAEPIFYAAVRMSLVALILSPLLRWHKGRMRLILAAGLCLGGLNYALMFTGLSLVNASIGAMVMELYAPFAMLLSVLFLKERVGLPRITALLVALCGIALIALSAREGAAGPAPFAGIALLAGAALSEASGAIFVKRIADVRPLELLGWFATAGAVFLWAMTLSVETGQWQAFTGGTLWPFLGSLAFSVLGASLFGHTTYYWLIQRRPVNQLSSSMLLISLIAVAGGVVLLGEPLSWQFIVGGILTMGGVGVILLRTKPSRPPAVPVVPAES